MSGVIDRNREPNRSPADPQHDVMEDGGRFVKFCAKCGRIVAYRGMMNTPWFATEAGRRACDWGS